MPKSSKTLEERFWAKVQKAGPEDCWLWTGAKTRDGYGSFNFEGRSPGESNPQAKLTPEQVDDIRSQKIRRSGYALKYGVTYWTVRDIQTGRIWRTQSSNSRAKV